MDRDDTHISTNVPSLTRKVSNESVTLHFATDAPVRASTSIRSTLSISTRNLCLAVAVAGSLNDTQAVWMVGICKTNRYRERKQDYECDELETVKPTRETETLTIRSAHVNLAQQRLTRVGSIKLRRRNCVGHQRGRKKCARDGSSSCGLLKVLGHNPSISSGGNNGQDDDNRAKHCQSGCRVSRFVIYERLFDDLGSGNARLQTYMSACLMFCVTRFFWGTCDGAATCHQ